MNKNQDRAVQFLNAIQRDDLIEEISPLFKGPDMSLLENNIRYGADVTAAQIQEAVRVLGVVVAWDIFAKRMGDSLYAKNTVGAWEFYLNCQTHAKRPQGTNPTWILQMPCIQDPLHLLLAAALEANDEDEWMKLCAFCPNAKTIHFALGEARFKLRLDNDDPLDPIVMLNRMAKFVALRQDVYRRCNVASALRSQQLAELKIALCFADFEMAKKIQQWRSIPKSQVEMVEEHAIRDCLLMPSKNGLACAVEIYHKRKISDERMRSILREYAEKVQKEDT